MSSPSSAAALPSRPAASRAGSQLAASSRAGRRLTQPLVAPAVAPHGVAGVEPAVGDRTRHPEDSVPDQWADEAVAQVLGHRLHRRCRYQRRVQRGRVTADQGAQRLPGEREIARRQRAADGHGRVVQRPYGEGALQQQRGERRAQDPQPPLDQAQQPVRPQRRRDGAPEDHRATVDEFGGWPLPRREPLGRRDRPPMATTGCHRAGGSPQQASTRTASASVDNFPSPQQKSPRLLRAVRGTRPPRQPRRTAWASSFQRRATDPRPGRSSGSRARRSPTAARPRRLSTAFPCLPSGRLCTFGMAPHAGYHAASIRAAGRAVKSAAELRSPRSRPWPDEDNPDPIGKRRGCASSSRSGGQHCGLSPARKA